MNPWITIVKKVQAEIVFIHQEEFPPAVDVPLQVIFRDIENKVYTGKLERVK